MRHPPTGPASPQPWGCGHGGGRRADSGVAESTYKDTIVGSPQRHRLSRSSVAGTVFFGTDGRLQTAAMQETAPRLRWRTPRIDGRPHRGLRRGLLLALFLVRQRDICGATGKAVCLRTPQLRSTRPHTGRSGGGGRTDGFGLPTPPTTHLRGPGTARQPWRPHVRHRRLHARRAATPLHAAPKSRYRVAETLADARLAPHHREPEPRLCRQRARDTRRGNGK